MTNSLTVLLMTSRHGRHRKYRSYFFVVQLLPLKHICLRSRYSVTVVVYLLISRSLPSNGSTCQILWCASITNTMKTVLYFVLFLFSVRNLTTISLAIIYSNEWWNDRWIINWKGFGRKRPCTYRSTVPAFAWRCYGNPRKSCEPMSPLRFERRTSGF
jgi:hypothetical protein